MEDKRKFKRFTVEFNVKVFEKDKIVGRVIDFSAGGIKVEILPEEENSFLGFWAKKMPPASLHSSLEQSKGEITNLEFMYFNKSLGLVRAKLVRTELAYNRIYLGFQFVKIQQEFIDNMIETIKRKNLTKKQIQEDIVSFKKIFKQD